MRRRNKKAEEKPPRMSRGEFERRLQKEIERNPNAPIDTIVNNVKVGRDADVVPATGQEPMDGGQGQAAGGLESEVSRPGFLKQIPRPLLIALPIFAIVIAIALAAIFLRPEGDGGDETPTSPATAEVVGDFDIRFTDLSSIPVAPGATVPIPLMVSAGGQPAAGVSLTFEVSPTEAGAVNLAAFTDTAGAATVDFIAGNTPQSVTITARLADNPDISESYTLTIAAQPGLTVSFKDPAPAGPVKVGEPFQIAFIVNNTGLVTAENVKLKVDTPPGLIISDPIDGGCTQNDSNLICEFAAINSAGNASKVIWYRADQAVETTFEPRSFRVTSNGGTAEIPGVEARTVRIEEPRAAKVVVVPAPAEVAADGTMTTTLQVDVQNQWGEAFNGPATVELAVERDGAGPIAALPTPPIMPQTVACFATVETKLTQFVGPDSAEQQQALLAETPMQAVALDVENARLYIIATVAGEEQSGWVPWPADTAQRTVNCPAGVADLPVSPPQETPAASPDGFILPQARQTFPEGTGSFDYRAGTVAGIIRIVARLIDGNNQPVGEPGQAAITLLETGSLATTSHIFKDPARSLGGDDPANMLLFSMPTGTPLELFPPDSAAPNARQVGLRVWVPAGVITSNESGETTLAAQLPPGTTVFTNPDVQPAPASPGTVPSQSFQQGANGLTVTVLEDRGDIRLVRLVGWVPSSALAQQ